MLMQSWSHIILTQRKRLLNNFIILTCNIYENLMCYNAGTYIVYVYKRKIQWNIP